MPRSYLRYAFDEHRIAREWGKLDQTLKIFHSPSVSRDKLVSMQASLCRCEIAWKIGSDSLLAQVSRVDSGGADETCFEQIEFGTAIHLSFHQFELGDLAFRLTV
jgi:hypothetical protein